MSKGILYALPRSAQRHEKADYARALELFQSQGQYEGDPVLVAHVVTHCFDRRIPFKWTVPGSGADGASKVTRA
jgi:hypothetical protein